MSVNVGTAYLEIIPSAKGFAGKLQGEVGSTMAGVGKSAGDKAGKSFGGAFSGRVKAIIGATVGLAAGGAAVGFLKDSIGEARESQKVGALTAQVIKTTGGAANVTAKQMGNLATAISNKTGIDDEQIQAGANMLLTFKNIRNEAGKGNKIFNQATQITTDMAAAMAAASGGQIDLKSSSIQVGKALNDPIKGITALGRVGVTFDDAQKKQIKTLVDSGHKMAAQKIILKELKSEFGGTAAATATSGEKLSVAFGNFKEQIGTALLPVIDKVEGTLTTKVIPAVSKFFGELQSGTGTGGKVADVFKRVAAAVGTFFAQMKSGTGPGGKVAEVLRRVADAVGTVFGFLAKHRETVITFVAVLGSLVAIIRVWTAVQTALDVVLAANPIGLVVVALAALVTGLIMAYKHSETFRNIVDTAFHAVATAASFMWDNVLKPIFKTWVRIWFTVIGAMVNGAASAFGWVPGIGGKLKAAAKKFNTFRDDVNRALDGIHPGKEIHITATVRQSVKLSSINKARVGIDGTRASGGPVLAGGTYLVGERGPELFTSGASGRIIPNHALARETSHAGGTAPGPQFHVDKVVAQDVNDFLRQMQTRARHSALDGVRR